MTIGNTLEETQRLQKEELHRKIDAMAETMYGITDAKNYKDYILGLVFYRYLCEAEEYLVWTKYHATVEECYTLKPKDLEAFCLKGSNLGFFIEPKNLFKKMVDAANKPVSNPNSFKYTDLRDAIIDYNNMVSKSEAKEAYENLLDGIKLDIVELGETPDEKHANVGSIIKQVASIDIDFKSSEIDLIGETYEYIIGTYSDISVSSKTGSFYTPKAIAEILARITCLGKESADSVYDPTSGSCSLLMSVKQHMEKDNKGKVKMFYSQELVPETYNLGRMNMILHGVKYNEFKAYRGNTLSNPLPSLSFIKEKFDIIVANFPYSTSVGATKDKPAVLSDEKLAKDERFNKAGAYPVDAKKGDYAFIEHIVYSLKEDGVAAIVCPHGVLFRGSKEETIRNYLVNKLNCIDAIIGLPANTFQNTGIAVCVLVIKKNRKRKDILFIDAQECYEHNRAINNVRESDIAKIVDAYKKYTFDSEYKGDNKFSSVVGRTALEENRNNLSISRYVDTFEEQTFDSIENILEKISKLQEKENTLENAIIMDLEKMEGIK